MIILFASGDGGPAAPPTSTGSCMMMGLGRGWVLPFLLAMKELLRYG